MNKRTHHPLTRRRLLQTLPAAALLWTAGKAQARTVEGTQRILIGTSGRGSKGIYVAHFLNGTLSTPVLAATAETPSFLAVPPGKSVLFACTEPDNQSHAASFNLPPGPGELDQHFAPIADVSSTSTGGCFISCTRDGSSVFVANYGGASVASFRADTQGHLTLVTLMAFPPTHHGPDKDRQQQSYAHSALPSPDGGYVFVNDLGLDRIHVLKFDPATSALTPHSEFLARPGSGPRHMLFHSKGHWLYSINELNSTIDQLDWDATTGTLKLRAVVGTLPNYVDSVGKRACDMVFSPGEKFLYAANRIYEDFAVFAVNPATGGLSDIQHLQNPGKESRHIAIDPTGHWFLSANQFSDDITVYPVDPTTGRLSPSISTVHLGAPSCLLFA